MDHTASEAVIFALTKSECLPILLYVTETCPTNSAARHSLDFAFKGELNLYNKWQSDDLFHIVINENHPRGNRF